MSKAIEDLTPEEQSTFRAEIGAVATSDPRLSDDRTPTNAGLRNTVIASTTAPGFSDSLVLPVFDPGGGGTFALFGSVLRSWVQSVINAMSILTGAKSFSGQVEMTGQAATNATSAMTRALGDARYNVFQRASATAQTDSSNHTALVTVPGISIPLLENTDYRVEVRGVFNSTVASSVRLEVVTSQPMDFTAGRPAMGFFAIGTATASTGGFSPSNTRFELLTRNTGAGNVVFCATGYFRTVNAGNLSLGLSQWASTAGVVSLLQNATCVVTKLS